MYKIMMGQVIGYPKRKIAHKTALSFIIYIENPTRFNSVSKFYSRFV
jgi:hypothetical protein